MLYVYILRSFKHPRQTYIGATEDLNGRLADHNEGRGAAHTNKFAPWEILVAIRFADHAKGWAFERYLKGGSGKAFISRHFL
ncbi:MAG: GIY-YIG nuclease family protein [Planctomycetes bacterium]|nr:GIY-YIG nuclease family protein [Planctomycetota bacterium]